MRFKIKSSWFENGTIKNVKAKAFFVYCKLRELMQINKSTQITIKELAKHSVQSKKDIINALRVLKENGCIDYDSRFIKDYDYKLTNTTQKFNIELLDLPMIEESFDKENYFTVVDMEIVNKLLKKTIEINAKKKENYLLTYVLLSRFKNNFCNISFDRIEQLTGISHTTLNSNICIKLEQMGFICSYFKKSLKGNKQNNFMVLRDISDFKDFGIRHDKQRIKNEIQREAGDLFG